MNMPAGAGLDEVNAAQIGSKESTQAAELASQSDEPKLTTPSPTQIQTPSPSAVPTKKPTPSPTPIPSGCFEVHEYTAETAEGIPESGTIYAPMSLRAAAPMEMNGRCDPIAVFNDPGSFAEALDFAKKHTSTYILFTKSGSLLWDNIEKMPEKARNTVPLITQMPELPRGCEVTSLAMLLASQGKDVDKLELSQKIKKDDTPYQRINGLVYFGDPNAGFVGSMKSLASSGYGVYHEPIFSLLSEYMPEDALDLTGCDFDDVFYFLKSGKPVWVITNAWYKELPESQFEEWMTPNGRIEITYREHSVLVTGYDSDWIYFNDPLGVAEKASKASFIKAWEQMGKQAVTVVG
jgi:uncharacterized protein YvpB